MSAITQVLLTKDQIKAMIALLKSKEIDRVVYWEIYDFFQPPKAPHDTEYVVVMDDYKGTMSYRETRSLTYYFHDSSINGELGCYSRGELLNFLTAYLKTFTPSKVAAQKADTLEQALREVKRLKKLLDANGIPY